MAGTDLAKFAQFPWVDVMDGFENTRAKRAVDSSLRAELEVIYTELDRDVAQAGPVCQLSGRCCRFEEFGHTLFVSDLEIEVLLEEGLPLGTSPSPSGCPFQRGNQCIARDRRPLGCRVFFCESVYQQRAAELSETYIARLKRLAESLGRAWRYGPLHVMLQQHLDA